MLSANALFERLVNYCSPECGSWVRPHMPFLLSSSNRLALAWRSSAKGERAATPSELDQLQSSQPGPLLCEQEDSSETMVGTSVLKEQENKPFQMNRRGTLTLFRLKDKNYF